MATDQKKPAKPKMPYSDFMRAIEAHRWMFTIKYEEVSYGLLSSLQQEENSLFREAVRCGPEYVRAYYHEMIHQLNGIKQETEKRIHDAYKKILEDRVPTGDEEFDEFRKMVLHHDWFYSYSDDGNVYRAGHEREKQILALVDKHGGLYATYYKKMAALNRHS